MSHAPAGEELLTEQARTPTIERRVIGPRGQEGILLRAPRAESLVWDLEAEVASARRCWLEDRDGWWVAESYLGAVIDLVLRSFASVLVLDRHEGDLLYSREGSVVRQERLL